MNAPVVTSLGHAGLRIDAPHLTMLCDPWMSPQGAFLGSWFPFPDNSHLLRPDVLDADWVTISHEHLDHLDLDLLRILPENVRIVIPRYPAPEMISRIRAAGIRNVVIELDRWERLALNRHGDWMTVIQEQSPMCHDSAVLVYAAGHAILHTNDARLTVAQLRRAVEEVGRPLDLMGVQMSGASWHPICYEYPPEVIASMSADKRIGKFKSVSRLLRAAPPKLVMPYAGPPCFLDPALAQHNDRIAPPGIFPDTGQAAAHLRSRLRDQAVVRLLPGDRLDVGTGVVEPDPHWEGFSLLGDRDDVAADGRLPDDLHAYLAAYAERRAGDVAAVYADFPDPPRGSGLAQRFAAHFEELGALSDYFLHRIGMTVRFVVDGEDGGTWDVELGPSRCSVDLTGSSPAPGYRITVEARWLDAVLTGRVRWEDLFLSLRISAWRDPDRYNDYLVGLLKHADAAALDEVERYETERDPEDTVTLAERTEDGRRDWEVSRYCPHAGEDLAHGAVIRDGVLRCLAHNFEFDLGTGECLNARCDPLVSRPVGSPVVAP
ncbi:Rieske 2Fe-2S domain-containing protein [Intrasporangium sp. YIM S08009]|uniref:Rieske 2Fe-2S domain-containing protein n=1 Tax=Intrasporangium zincisolvens TaxID=3080018 RepID=UPI002B057B54|nr:MBL fold metallo-hydrolase [Intrasporangium sp. YIM S08009]